MAGGGANRTSIPLNPAKSRTTCGGEIAIKGRGGQ